MCVCVLFYRVFFDYKKWRVTKSVMRHGYHPACWPIWYWTPSLFRRPFHRSISVLLKISCKEKVSFCFIKGSNFDEVLSLKSRTWPATLWEERMQREGGWLRWGEGMECGAWGGGVEKTAGSQRRGGGGSWGGLSHDLNSPVWECLSFLFYWFSSFSRHIQIHKPSLANICMFGYFTPWPVTIKPTEEMSHVIDKSFK